MLDRASLLQPRLAQWAATSAGGHDSLATKGTACISHLSLCSCWPVSANSGGVVCARRHVWQAHRLGSVTSVAFSAESGNISTLHAIDEYTQQGQPRAFTISPSGCHLTVSSALWPCTAVLSSQRPPGSDCAATLPPCLRSASSGANGYIQTSISTSIEPQT